MTIRGRKERILRALAATGLGLGSTAALGGCDPAVRQVWLSGLEVTTGTLLDTLNSAFYISLDDEETTGTDTLTTT